MAQIPRAITRDPALRTSETEKVGSGIRFPFVEPLGAKNGQDVQKRPACALQTGGHLIAGGGFGAGPGEFHYTVMELERLVLLCLVIGIAPSRMRGLREGCEEQQKGGDFANMCHALIMQPGALIFNDNRVLGR